jgi:hypothetical protein
MAWFNSYDEKARTANNSGSDFDLNFNSNFPYEIEFKFGFEAMDVLEKDRKNFAA